MREAWIIATVVAALLLVAAPLSAQQRAQPTGAQVVACSGAFAKDSSHLKLAMFFDSKNITFTDVEASGSKVPASVLFPNDPKRRLDGGALAAVAGGCKPGVSLRADAKASAEKIGALSVDEEYSSSDPAIRAAKPTVSEILIGY